MSGMYRDERGTEEFWQEVGLDNYAAWTAAKCFPESWIRSYEDASRRLPVSRVREWERNGAEREAIDQARKVPLEHRTNARHPAFWLEQGYDFDEAAARAVAANAMVQLQRDAAPPQQPKPDRFLDVANALLMQATMQQRMEGPNDSYDIIDVQPTPADQPRPEPFDPADYPRFRVD